MSNKEELLKYYADLLILQYRTKSKARATIEALADEVSGDFLPNQILDGFNIDTAVGKQLDILGKYLGLERYQAPYGNLTDDELRILIKFAILKSSNLSSTKDISEAIYSLFGDKISLVDNKDMTIRYNISSSIDEVVVNILVNKDLLLRPMGVRLETLYADEVLGFEGSDLQTFDNGVFYDPEQQIVINTKSLIINCNEPGVTVVINNSERRTLELTVGDGYTWSVSKEGYQTVSGSGTLNSDTIIDISAFQIKSLPTNATVIINGTEQKGILFETGTTLNYTYSVSASGYNSETGSGSTTSSLTLSVALGHTLTINAPEGATVNINGEEVSSAYLPDGSNYTWSVSRSGYLTASGSGIIREHKTINVYSVLGVNAIFNFNNSGQYLAYAEENSTISYVASQEGYISYSGTKLITDNTIIDTATLTVNVTPTTATVTINGSTGTKALFENGVDFAYTIVATRGSYPRTYTKTVTGITDHSITVDISV